MAPCPTCGTAGQPGARYCARCGSGLDGHGFELLAVGAVIRSEESVSHHQSDRRWPLAVLVLAVLGWLAWPVATGSGPGASGIDSSNQTLPTTALPTTALPTTALPTTTLPVAGPGLDAGSDSRRGAGASGGEGGRGRRDGPTPLSPRPTPLAAVPASSTSTTIVVGPGGPVLGKETGLSLLVGNPAGLRRLDLDTGAVTAYDVAGWPLATAASWLVLGNPDRQWLRAVPLADPGSNPQLLGYTAAPGLAAAGLEPSQVWYLDAGSGSADPPRWVLADLDTGHRLDEAPVSGQGHHTADPGVGSTNAGGVHTNVVGPVGGGVGPDVYRDEFRKVFDGRPLAVSAGYVVTQTCTTATLCRLQWLDRGTWQVEDRPVPDGRTFWDGWLSDDGRILAYHRDDAGAEVFDVARGRMVDLTPVGPRHLALSPDGRWLAGATASGFVIHDLERDRTIDVDLGPPADHRLLFVPAATDGR